MGASSTKEDEYIDLVRYMMKYADEKGTLPGVDHPKYRDVCNFRNGIKSGRIAKDRKSVVFVMENFPEMIYDWRGYRKKLESKEVYRGRLNKRFLDSELTAVINSQYPDEVYIGVTKLYKCLCLLREKRESVRTVVVSEKTFNGIANHLSSEGSLLKLSYSDFVLLSVILYGVEQEVSSFGREETVGHSLPLINTSDGYIDFLFRVLWDSDLNRKLDEYLDNEVYTDTHLYGGYAERDTLRDIVCMYDVYSGKTLEEVGKGCNPPITRERVRQLVVRVSQRIIKKHRKAILKIMEVGNE